MELLELMKERHSVRSYTIKNGREDKRSFRSFYPTVQS